MLVLVVLLGWLAGRTATGSDRGDRGPGGRGWL